MNWELLLEHLAQPVGYGGLLAFVVWAVLTGRLVPGKERDVWRDAFFAQQEATTELLETTRLIQDALREGQRARQPQRRVGGSEHHGSPPKSEGKP